MRRWVMMGAVLLAISACQLALPGKDDPVETAVNPILGDQVEVTSLDAPKPAPAATAAPAEAALPEARTSAAVAEAPPPPEPAPQEVVVVKSPAQLACEKRKGVWTAAGSGSANFCQKVTRDAGKTCEKSTQCEGYCLARSRSCAPITPMFGCQDILNEDGRMLTECIN